MMKYRIGIIGSTGYTGVVLTRLLMSHPDVEITYLSSGKYSDKYYYEAYPMFYDQLKIKCKPLEAKAVAKECDLVFLATPNDFAKDFAPKLFKENPELKIIDLSADFRLEKDLCLNKKNSIKIIYGIPEIYRSEIKNATLVANPGCYPTSVILGLAPLLKNQIIDTSSIIIDSKSGSSGAGKQPKQELHFCEVNESFSAYKLGGKHRHIPEMENELSKLANEKEINIIFSPHLLPVNRGILSTIYADLNSSKITTKEIKSLYENYYKNEFFVKVLPEDVYANIKNVRYSNFCHLMPLKDDRLNKVIIVSTIDNMVKGAAGQAIQNMNLMLSIKETTALENLGHLP